MRLADRKITFKINQTLSGKSVGRQSLIALAELLRDAYNRAFEEGSVPMAKGLVGGSSGRKQLQEA